MKKILTVLLVSSAMVALSANHSVAASSAEKEIRALVATFTEGMRAKDVKKIMSVYSTGNDLLVFDAIPPRQYVGADAYGKDFEELFKMFPGPMQTFEVSDLEIETDSHLAYSHSIQHGVMTDAEGKKTEFTVRATDVYKKIGGKWRIVHEHLSWPVDPMTGKADMASKP